MNKKWFEDRGYKYSKMREPVCVHAKDLMPSSKQLVHVTCDYCGKSYDMEYYRCKQILDSDVPKFACTTCFSKKISEARLKKEAHKQIEAAREKCRQNGYELLTTEDEYTGVKMMASYLCPKHGIKATSLDSIIRGHICFECSYERDRCKSMRHSCEYIKEAIDSTGDAILLNQEDYKNATTNNLNIRCACGNRFTTSYVNFMNGQRRCRICSSKESNGEERIRKYLESHGINFIPEYKFADCKDKRQLPFDFYLLDYGRIIEYDGIQHFKPFSFNGDYSKSMKNYEELKRHDSIKNKYCEDNGIPLLRIPYYAYENIEQILDDYLNLV